MRLPIPYQNVLEGTQMRKWLIVLFALLGAAFVSSAAYAEEFDGYIFEPQYPISTYSIFSQDFEHIGNGVYVADTLEDIYNVYEEDELISVYPNYRLELFEISYPETTSDTKIDSQWNLEMIGAQTSRQSGVFGKNVKIAVIDSGLDTEHKDLKQTNILQGYNCMETAENVYDVTDTYGHGTSVTGIISAQIDNGYGIAGIAPDASIIPIKITDGKDLNLTDIYAGINKAIELDADIINLSLGGALTNQIAISEFKKYIDKAVDDGILIIAAGGNNGTTAVNYPAGFDNVIGVGSVNSAGNLDYQSHKNESIFITAPGRTVPCLVMDSKTDTSSGSSIATPHVTSAVAIIKQVKPDITLEEVKTILANTATDKGTEGYDTSYGYGILNIDGIINSVKEYLPKLVISQGTSGTSPRLHIHNNSESLTADAYFASYDSNNRLLDINLLDDTIVKTGVTTLDFNASFDKFFLWSDNLRPFTDKFVIYNE